MMCPVCKVRKAQRRLTMGEKLSGEDTYELKLWYVCSHCFDYALGVIYRLLGR